MHERRMYALTCIQTILVLESTVTVYKFTRDGIRRKIN